MSSLNIKKAILDLLNGSYATTGYYGLSDVYANTDSITDSIWSYHDAAKRTQYMAALAANPIKVRGEYVRSEYEVPVIVVVQQPDRERSEFLGDYIGIDEDLSDDFNEVHTFGVDVDESILLVIQSAGKGSKSQRDDLYQVVRELLLRARMYFESLGALNFTWTRGQNGEGKRGELQPHVVHQATININYTNPIRWTEKKQRITEFNGSLEGYGGIVSVNPYTQEA